MAFDISIRDVVKLIFLAMFLVILGTVLVALTGIHMVSNIVQLKTIAYSFGVMTVLTAILGMVYVLLE